MKGVLYWGQGSSCLSRHFMEYSEISGMKTEIVFSFFLSFSFSLLRSLLLLLFLSLSSLPPSLPFLPSFLPSLLPSNMHWQISLSLKKCWAHPLKFSSLTVLKNLVQSNLKFCLISSTYPPKVHLWAPWRMGRRVLMEDQHLVIHSSIHFSSWSREDAVSFLSMSPSSSL